MKNDFNYNLIIALISFIGLVALSVFGYYISRLDGLSDKIYKLDTSVTVIRTVLKIQMPQINLDALIAASIDNKVPQEKIVATIIKIEKDPIQAKEYMRDELKFDNKEINSIFVNPDVIQHNEPGVINSIINK